MILNTAAQENHPGNLKTSQCLVPSSRQSEEQGENFKHSSSDSIFIPGFTMVIT